MAGGKRDDDKVSVGVRTENLGLLRRGGAGTGESGLEPRGLLGLGTRRCGLESQPCPVPPDCRDALNPVCQVTR